MLIFLVEQDSIDKTGLGKDSNAIVWPRGPPDEEDDEEGPENWKNQRFMRLGTKALQHRTVVVSS